MTALLSLCIILVALASTGGLSSFVWTEFFVAVSNLTDGVGIKIVSARDNIVHEQNFTGLSLSPVNTNEIWVENITSTEDSARYLLLLPLLREVGLLEVHYSGHWTTELSAIELPGVEGLCETLYIQRIINVPYSVCIFRSGSNSMSMRLHEINLNSSFIEESSAALQIFGSLDGSEFTNVVYAHRDRVNREFYVIVDDVIRSINPINHERDSIIMQPQEECDNVTFRSLQYISSTQSLLAHISCCTENQGCSQYGVYYDTHGEDEYPVITTGLPFQCPNSEYTVLVDVALDQLCIETEESTNCHNLEGEGFMRGLCSGTSENPWFAYQDSVGQIFAVDLSSSSYNSRSVSENSCVQGSQCSPIRNISDILVIQQFDNDSGHILVMGTRLQSSFSSVFELESKEPSFIALVNIPMADESTSVPPSHTPTPPFTLTEPTSTPNSTRKSSTPTTVIVIAIVVIFVVVVVVVVFLIILVIMISIYTVRKRADEPRPKPANSTDADAGNGSQNNIVPNDEDSDQQQNGEAIAMVVHRVWDQDPPIQLNEHDIVYGESGTIAMPVESKEDHKKKCDMVPGRHKADPTMFNSNTVQDNYQNRENNEEKRNDLMSKSF